MFFSSPEKPEMSPGEWSQSSEAHLGLFGGKKSLRDEPWRVVTILRGSSQTVWWKKKSPNKNFDDLITTI
jgi:hypothetical protein